MPDITFDVSRPRHAARVVSIEELPSLYEEVSADSSPTFTWNDGGDQVLIVTVGSDYSTVTMKDRDTFSNLVVSDEPGTREIDIGGLLTSFPQNAILPRALGLEVLLNAERFEELRNEYSWMPQ